MRSMPKSTWLRLPAQTGSECHLVVLSMHSSMGGSAQHYVEVLFVIGQKNRQSQ